MLNPLNPKSIPFLLVVVPRFVELSARPPWLQTILLGGLYVATATTIHAAIVLLATRFALILENGLGAVVQRRVMAVLF